MSNSDSRFWGTSKHSAYVGWFITLIGGLGIGVGAGFLVFIRAYARVVPSLNPNLGIDPEIYANFQLLSVFFIFVGLICCVLGIGLIHHSQKTLTGKSSQKTIVEESTTSVSKEKKYCRYCGTENKNDAVFCEKCGKRISE